VLAGICATPTTSGSVCASGGSPRTSCAIGSHAIIIDNDFFHRSGTAVGGPPSAPIILEENVWLGARVIVLRGVTIGAHSVSGAGSVVTRNIPPRSVAVGLPGRVVKSI
jgi:acetyltransferase-like isoleucine patch superfamily enzyme